MTDRMENILKAAKWHSIRFIQEAYVAVKTGVTRLRRHQRRRAAPVWVHRLSMTR